MKENNILTVLEEVKYPVDTNEIKAFLDEWKEIPTLDPLSEDKEPYKLVKKAHIKAVSFRTSIEKKRKELKSPALAYGKQVDSIAKEFQELVNPKELELYAARSVVDQYEKEQEQFRINAEKERVENIGSAITHLKMIPLDAIGKTSEELIVIYDAIVIPDEATYEERLDEAILTYKETISKLETAIEQAKLAENAEAIQAEAEAKRKKEEAILEEERRKEREVFENERAEFEKAKQEQERVVREQQEEIDRQRANQEAKEFAVKQEQERVVREQQQAELRKQKESEDKELYDKRWNEACDAIEECEKAKEHILDWIIEGKIPNVKWI